MSNPTKSLVVPILSYTFALGGAGSGTEFGSYDLGDAVSFFVIGGSGLGLNDVLVQLGDDAPEFPILSGIFIRTSGFRRFKVRNTNVAARTVTILFSADPQFLAAGISRNTGLN